MRATGIFDVDLTPQDDADTPAGRMLLKKSYRGDMSGSAAGQMLSKRLENGPAAYFAVEEFSGSINGKEGSFTLLHAGRLSDEGSSLEITILPGSGTGELATISGSMSISQDAEGHRYDLEYEL